MFELGLALKQERGPENVFDLSLGNPVMEPPPEFYKELRRLANDSTLGMHRYMPNLGYMETRQAVATQLAKETGVPYQGANVMMSVGAGGGINVAIHALADQGDEIIIFAPYFAEYIFYAYNHYAIPVVISCDSAFIPNLAELESKLTPKTKAVLLNSPNNPAGVVYGEPFLRDLASLLERKSTELGIEIFIISDEPYRKLIFDKVEYTFPQTLYQRTITVNSHSKDLALPGERIGYVAIHPDYIGGTELMDALAFCNRVLGFVNAPALMQRLARALQGVTVDISDYQHKRDFLYDNLTAMGYKVVKPQGAFYMFPESPIADELKLIEMLQEYGVLVVPGRGFGMPGYFRISYCVEQRDLDGAMNGFRAVAKELGLAST
jgi:aspartate aminotransferase